MFGETTGIRTPVRRSSRCRAGLKPITAALAPESATRPATGFVSVALAMLTIVPWPRASLMGNIALVAWTGET